MRCKIGLERKYGIFRLYFIPRYGMGFSTLTTLLNMTEYQKEQEVIDMKTRNEIQEHLKWDLSRLFQSEEEYEKALAVCQSMSETILATYKGNIVDAEVAGKALEAYNSLFEKIDIVSNYAELSFAVDMTDAKSQKRQIQCENKLADIFANIKFVEEEISNLEKSVLEELNANYPEYSVFVEQILLKKPYMLGSKEEFMLEMLSPALESNYKGYEITKMSDIEFPDFEVNGKKYLNSYVLFENEYQYSEDTALRREATKQFYAEIKKYENTTAHYYQSHVQKEKILSDLRGHRSIFDYLLLEQNISRDLYDRQIDVIMEKLAPHMRKYANLIKKEYQLDRITFADLKVPLDTSFQPEISIEESKEYVKGALAFLGEEYLNMIMAAYEERWVDYAQNVGKSTGGFCSSPYRKKAYILLSWTGLLSEVFTLVHEFGHAGHFILAQAQNSYLNTEPSLYFIEAPSTMNELLLTQYLLNKYEEDPKMKRWVLSNMISNTYFHNFVTHLLEAAYQREVYRIIDEGGSVQAEELSEIKRSVLEAFWGDEVEINDGSELTWMRQPHYYMGLYPYTYSAGLTIGTQMCKKIVKEGKAAADQWIEVLKAGGTKHPVELAKMVGIDITTEQPLLDTIEFIGKSIDEIERLTEVLSKER